MQLTMLVGVIGLVLAGILKALLTDEAKAWLPVLTRRIVEAGSSRFRDSEMRERTREEWLASIDEIPGPLVKLLHAISLFVCARRVEGEWFEDLSPVDVDAEIGQLESQLKAFSDRLRSARIAKGISILQIALQTRISVDALRVLEDGNIRKFPAGIFLRSHLQEYCRVVGPEFSGIYAQAIALLRKRGRYPRAAPRKRSLRCHLSGHHSVARYLHSDRYVQFHCYYFECEVCGRVSRTWSEPCRGKKRIAKMRLDEPLREVWTCESNFTYPDFF